MRLKENNGTSFKNKNDANKIERTKMKNASNSMGRREDVRNLFKNNLRIIVLKSNTFATYNLNVYFILRITSTKVPKFTSSAKHIDFRPLKPKISTTNIVKIMCFGMNLQTLII